MHGELQTFSWKTKEFIQGTPPNFSPWSLYSKWGSSNYIFLTSLLQMSPSCPPQASTGHLVQGHINMNPEIILRCENKVFSKPGALSSASGQIQGWLEIHWRTSHEIHPLGEVSSFLLGPLSHTSPKCTIWRDPLSPGSCGRKNRRDQAGCTGGWKHRYQNTTPGRRDNCLSHSGLGMKDVAPKWWRLAYHSR